MAEMSVFLQRAWRCTMFERDDKSEVYEKLCDRTLVAIIPHPLEEVIAYHLSHEHLLPTEMFEVRAIETEEHLRPPGLADDDLAGYDFAGFGQWTYVQSVIRAMSTIR